MVDTQTIMKGIFSDDFYRKPAHSYIHAFRVQITSWAVTGDDYEYVDVAKCGVIQNKHLAYDISKNDNEVTCPNCMEVMSK